MHQRRALVHQGPCKLQFGTQTAVLRQVIPPPFQISGAVLPKVNQLQSAANRVALRQALRIVYPIQMQHQPTHGVGRTTAVVH